MCKFYCTVCLCVHLKMILLEKTRNKSSLMMVSVIGTFMNKKNISQLFPLRHTLVFRLSKREKYQLSHQFEQSSLTISKSRTYLFVCTQQKSVKELKATYETGFTIQNYLFLSLPLFRHVSIKTSYSYIDSSRFFLL